MSPSPARELNSLNIGALIDASVRAMDGKEDAASKKTTRQFVCEAPARRSSFGASVTEEEEEGDDHETDNPLDPGVWKVTSGVGRGVYGVLSLYVCVCVCVCVGKT